MSGGVIGKAPARTAADLPSESAYGANVILEAAMRSAMFDPPPPPPLVYPWVTLTAQAFDMNKIGGVDPANPRQPMEWSVYGRLEAPDARVTVDTGAGGAGPKVTVPIGALWDVTAVMKITAGAGPVGVERTMRFGARGTCAPILGSRPRGSLEIRVRRAPWTVLFQIAQAYDDRREELMNLAMAQQWRVRADITPGAPYTWTGNTTARAVELELPPPP